MTVPTVESVSVAWGLVRSEQPLVQCLTNVVVAGWTANVLLAAGAAPVMVDNEFEAGDCARIAGGVLVNLGTPQQVTAEAMREAVRARRDLGTAWVLDPVAAGVLAWRTDLARELIGLHPPAIIRGNASEISALALDAAAGGRGVDSTTTAAVVLPEARALAQQYGAVVAVSGEVDHIVSPDGQLVRLGHGHHWLTRVTGGGCALGALMAAGTTVAEPFTAAIAATAGLTLAAEEAAQTANGPGTFAPALLDALDQLGPQEMADRLHLTGTDLTTTDVPITDVPVTDVPVTGAAD